jgi:hypothetical protein
MAFIQSPTHVCRICNKTLSLEECKFDEYGKPVHEECYVFLVKWQKEQTHKKAA